MYASWLGRSIRTFCALTLVVLVTWTPAAGRPQDVRARVWPAPHRLGSLFGIGSFVTQRSSSIAPLMVSRLRMLGASWVREEFTATRLHSATRAPYQWWTYDQVVNRERGAGLQILGLLDYSNSWGYGDHGSMPHAAMLKLAADFARYAYRMVRHFRGRITYWQVWNEPDLAAFWHPTPRPDDYALLLDTAARAIKRANSRARVVLAGLSGIDFPFLRAVMARTRRFDVISVHPYRVLPETRLLAAVRALERLGKPVWFSEIGWPAGQGCTACTNESSQAHYLVRFYALSAAAGVRRVFWYDLRDDEHLPPSPEGHYGLMNQDLSGKPAFAAFSYLTHLMRQASYIASDSLGGGGAFALRFSTNAGPVAVVWNAGKEYLTVHVRWAAPSAEVLDINGARQGTAGTREGFASWSLPPGSGPFYLVQRATSAPMTAPGALLRIPHPEGVRRVQPRRTSINRGASVAAGARSSAGSRSTARPREKKLRARSQPTVTPRVPTPWMASPSPPTVTSTPLPTVRLTPTSTPVPTAAARPSAIATAFPIPGGK
jgi:Glycosyl hydrolase catalytic core